ncbi:MAG: hypothetical protein ACRDD7_14815 [Peptostreptococcaceae bacterium]
MDNKIKKLEESLPRNCCSFCTHLSLEGPREDYTYDITCVMFDDKPKPCNCCEYFKPEHTKLSTNDLDNMYIDFLETCLRIDFEDYLNSIHWKIFKDKALRSFDYKCSICGSSYNVNVHHIRKNLGRETLNDILVICDECFPR